jgi:threonine dehydratase
MPTLADIRAARERIRDSIYLSPCAYSETFSQMTGSKVSFKLENLQMTGSFKERGALNKILLLSKEERARGVITASAGNHAQGVAYHATRQGIRAQVCMPIASPLIKISRTREYGAEVILIGNNYDEAYEEARRRCESEVLTFVHPFDDEAVIAGQGTIGLELLEQNPELEAVVAPIGGGGLIAGIACVLKEANPRVRVIGVETAKLPSMKMALAEGKPLTLPAATTIGDGIAVRRAGDLTLPMVRRYVDDVVTVDEEEMASAILLLLEREKTVAEGAGAAAVAALLHHKTSLAGKRIVVLISGGNIDVNFLARIIERGLVKDGRLVRLQLRVPDRAGSLAGVMTVIAAQRANVVGVSHDRSHYGASLGQAVLDVTLETRGSDHIEEIVAALAAAGYRADRIL